MAWVEQSGVRHAYRGDAELGTAACATGGGSASPSATNAAATVRAGDERRWVGPGRRVGHGRSVHVDPEPRHRPGEQGRSATLAYAPPGTYNGTTECIDSPVTWAPN